MNMFSHLEEAAGKWGDEIAVVHNGRAFQYAELYAAAESIAIILQRVGVGAGDKVGLMFPSSPEAIAASFAVWRLKAVMVSIGAVLKSDEVCRLAENIGVDVFCYCAPYKRVIPDAGGVESVVWEGRTPLRVGLAAARPAAQSERDQLRGIDAAAIYFSSGTTAESKGVVLSHKTLIERARNVAEAPPVDRRDSLLWLQSTA